MNSPKISVIITAYNIENYIEECINSVILQGIGDIEIICVDDASTDNTYSVLKKISEKENRIQIIRNKENVGQATARNMGCHAAHGEYIYILDGDDRLKKNALNRLYDCAKKNRLDVLTFSGDVFFDNDQMLLKYYNQSKIYIRKGHYSGVYSGPELFVKMIEQKDKHGNICFQFIKRDFFVKNNLYFIDRLRYGEDSPFAIYMSAQRAMCISDILYSRRFRENSIITSQKQMCHLESLMIQYVNDLFLWHSKKLTNEINEKIDYFFALQLKSIKNIMNDIDLQKSLVMLKQYPVAYYIYRYLVNDTPLYCDLLTNENIDEIKKHNSIIIFGAGKIATYVIDFLQNHGITNYKIAVSDKKLEVKSGIYNITELLQDKESAIVLVAVGNKYKDEIWKTLINLGFKNIMDVSKY